MPQTPNNAPTYNHFVITQLFKVCLHPIKQKAPLPPPCWEKRALVLAGGSKPDPRQLWPSQTATYTFLDVEGFVQQLLLLNLVDLSDTSSSGGLCSCS